MEIKCWRWWVRHESLSLKRARKGQHTIVQCSMNINWSWCFVGATCHSFNWLIYYVSTNFKNAFSSFNSMLFFWWVGKIDFIFQKITNIKVTIGSLTSFLCAHMHLTLSKRHNDVQTQKKLNVLSFKLVLTHTQVSLCMWSRKWTNASIYGYSSILFFIFGIFVDAYKSRVKCKIIFAVFFVTILLIKDLFDVAFVLKVSEDDEKAVRNLLSFLSSYRGFKKQLHIDEEEREKSEIDSEFEIVWRKCFKVSLRMSKWEVFAYSISTILHNNEKIYENLHMCVILSFVIQYFILLFFWFYAHDDDDDVDVVKLRSIYWRKRTYTFLNMWFLSILLFTCFTQIQHHIYSMQSHLSVQHVEHLSFYF